MPAARACIGTAGWGLPRASRSRFPGAASNLERYAAVFRAVEINSTFYRAHRASTFERWAQAVPRDFRFCAKLPRAITHECKLAGTRRLVDEFLGQVSPLGTKLACLLVQLPPSLALDRRVARAFLAALRARFAGDIALEPRHESWFTDAVDRMLRDLGIARVAADPARGTTGLEPGGCPDIAYFRLHGSPRIYFSSYDQAFLDAMARRLRELARRRVRCWCIFDNTTLGAATANALALMQRAEPAALP